MPDIGKQLAAEWAALGKALAPSLPGNPRALLAGPVRGTLLFAELEDVRRAWEEMRRSPGIRAEAGRLVTSRWTLRDLLAHVASWASEFRGEAETILGGGTIGYEIYFHPGAGPTEWNHARVAERKSQTLGELFGELDVATRRLQELVLRAPADRLSAAAKFAPVIGVEHAPLVRSLAELAGARCFHDRHHMGRITEWRAKLR